MTQKDEKLQPSLYDDDPSRLGDLADESAEKERESAYALMALSSMKGVGPVTINRIFKNLNGEPHKLWDADDAHLPNILGINQTAISRSTLADFILNRAKYRSIAEGQVEALERKGTFILFPSSALYPKKLLDLKDPPTWLFAHGDPRVLHGPNSIAVVGTRDPSDAGIASARIVSKSIIELGGTIVSGLAEGIDEISHQTSVDFGRPTIAVLGHGLDVIFPAKTAGLRKEIIDTGGCVISEYLPYESFSREKFVMRNRIQASLSCCVCVIEGRAKSGTAHTVRFANELHREIFGAHLRLESDIRQPNLEILQSLSNTGHPVFDISGSRGKLELRSLITAAFSENETHQTLSFQLFEPVAAHARLIARRYGATRSDLDWLIDEVEKMAKMEDFE